MDCIRRITAFALCGAVTTTMAIALADTYTWHGPGDAVGSGIFSTAGNWFDSTGNRTQTIPGAADDITVGNNGVNTWTAQTVTLDGDASVASLKVEGGNARALGKVAYLNLALGGYTLDVAGQLYMEGIQGWSGTQSGRCTVQGGGTMNVASVQIGRTNEAGQGSGSLVVKDSGTTLKSTGDVSIEGPFTSLEVSGGATLNGSALWVNCERAPRSAIGGTGWEKGSIRITNSNTKVSFGGFRVCRDVNVSVSDGASLSITSWKDGGTIWLGGTYGGAYYGNAIGRNDGFSCGNYGTFVLDNATFSSGNHFAIGYSTAASGGSGATMTLQNGAKYNAGFVHVGFAADDVRYNATNDVLNVLSGSELTANGAALLVSRFGQSSFGKLNVSNATVKCGFLEMGGKGSATIASNACLTVSGAAPSITLSSTSAEAFKVRMGSQVRFVIPEDGFAATPITVSKGGVSIVADENDYAVDPVRLVLDANAFGKKHPQGTVTLIECATASAESLQRLADNLVFVDTPDRRKGTVSVVDGTKLVYTAPPPQGMVVSFK
jgi:hypothetical protein